jgi:hypothetical protein
LVRAGVREMKKIRKLPAVAAMTPGGPFILNEGHPMIPATVATKAKAAIEPTELARAALERMTAEGHVLFDAAVAAEAARLHRKVSTSAKFASAVKPGLEKQGFVAGRSKILAATKRLKIK